MAEIQNSDWGTRKLERSLGQWVRRHFHWLPADFIMFVLKQAWAALFGGLLLCAIIITKLVWPENAPIQRYDFLFLYAVTVQICMYVFHLETKNEVRVILLFHITGTAMEIFKVSQGSWAYPEPRLFDLAGVPLFSGFMYASIGSYIARAIRIFEMTFAPFPPLWLHFGFGVAVYVNFFAHHFLPDIRMALFIGSVILYGRTRVWFYNSETPRWMPMPLAALLTAGAVWIAENVGTMTQTWQYAGQNDFELVSFSKMGSWYLLLYLAFATVTIVYNDKLKRRPVTPPVREIARAQDGAEPA